MIFGKWPWLVGGSVLLLCSGLLLAYQTVTVKIWIADLRWDWYGADLLRSSGGNLPPEQWPVGPEVRALQGSGAVVLIDETLPGEAALFRAREAPWLFKQEGVPKALKVLSYLKSLGGEEAGVRVHLWVRSDDEQVVRERLRRILEPDP